MTSIMEPGHMMDFINVQEVFFTLEMYQEYSLYRKGTGNIQDSFKITRVSLTPLRYEVYISAP